MRSFALILSVQGLCTGFSPVKTTRHNDVLARSVLRATNDAREGEVDFQLQRKVAGIAATLALGWTVGVGSSIAAPTTIPLGSDWTSPSTPLSSSSSSSTLVVAMSESDYADFSLPSYKEVTTAEVNTNLKGGKQLFGEDTTARLTRYVPSYVYSYDGTFIWSLYSAIIRCTFCCP